MMNFKNLFKKKERNRSWDKTPKIHNSAYPAGMTKEQWDKNWSNFLHPTYKAAKLLIIILLILTSCGREPFSPGNNKSIITNIDKYTNSLCWYYGDGISTGTKAPFAYDFKICDSCGKFQIGDTLKLTK